MRVSIVAVLSVFCLMVAGCSSPSLVGKWQGVENGISANLEFKADKTYLSYGTTPLGPMMVTGAYTFEKNKVTMTVGEIRAPGVSQESLAAGRRRMPKTSGGIVKFIGDDTMEVLATNGTTITMNRVKEGK